MARITVRVDDETKKKMDRVDENWSQVARKAIQKRLAADRRRRIQRLVSEYEDDDDRLEKLQILHTFSYGMSKQYVYETAELLFGEPKDDLVDDVEYDLEGDGLARMYDRLEGTKTRLGVAIREEIAERTGDSLKTQLETELSDAPPEIRQGIHILTQYVRDKLDEEQSVSIIPDGFERTWKLYTDIEEDEAEINRLVEIGALYKDYYSSNAYGHKSYKVPDYTLDLLSDLLKDDVSFYVDDSSISDIQATLEKQDTQHFLQWVGGRQRYVSTRDEDEEITRELDDQGLSLNADVDDVRRELVRNDILYIDYSPHRSSAGGRSSRPSRWIYRLTDEALDELPEVLLQSS